MRKKSYITVTDQFCGAGGSSQGVRSLSNENGGGLEVKLALNHWKLAIETHNTNFPDTMHDCTDISACDPRRYPSTDILITSPECTNHSLAKGVKIVQKQMDLFTSGAQDASAERSRATMWDVCRFAEVHKYNAIIVENVVDARKWVLFDAWLQAMYVLGYMHKCVYLNSMHCHPTPQSRDRMYIVFWKKGNKVPNLEYLPLSYCPKCEKDVLAVQVWKNTEKRYGKYKQQYVYCCPHDGTIVEPYYYAAFNCIDWSDLGKRIGDRVNPLSPNTVKRIKHGLNKYGKEPYIMHAAYSDKARGVVRSVTDPCFTQTTLESQAIVNQPFLVNDQQTTGIDCRVKGVTENMQTVSTCAGFKVVMPMVIKNEHTLQEGMVHSATDTMQTQLTRQTMGVLTPFIVDGNYDAKPSRAISVNAELPTNTTQPRLGIVNQPYIIEMNKTGECKPADNAASTITAGGINHAILNAPLIVENKGQSNSRNVFSPLATQTAKPYLGLITHEAWNSFIASYYGGSDCTKHITEEIGTVRTGDCHTIVNYKTPEIEDCYYRMLKPKEIKLAMAFDKDYVVLGSGKWQVKQLGNAVTPPAMKWLVKQVIQSLS